VGPTNWRCDMRKRIEEWYRGPWMAPPPNDPNSPIVFISAGSNEPHWTARAARALVGFWLAHWQFIIGTVLTVTGLLIACKSSARDRAVRGRASLSPLARSRSSARADHALFGFRPARVRQNMISSCGRLHGRVPRLFAPVSTPGSPR